MIICISSPPGPPRSQPDRGISLSHLYSFPPSLPPLSLCLLSPSIIRKPRVHARDTILYTPDSALFLSLLFPRPSQSTILPRWKTSSGPNVFRVRGPWVRLINTERPDRLVPTPPLFFLLFLLFLALARSREYLRMIRITLVSIFIMILFVSNFNIPSCLF